MPAAAAQRHGVRAVAAAGAPPLSQPARCRRRAGGAPAPLPPPVCRVAIAAERRCGGGELGRVLTDETGAAPAVTRGAPPGEASSNGSGSSGSGSTPCASAGRPAEPSARLSELSPADGAASTEASGSGRGGGVEGVGTSRWGLAGGRRGQAASSSVDTMHGTGSHGAAAAAHDWRARLSSLLTSPYDSVILSLAAPAILALAADPLLAIVDTAIVGQLGSNELAALGVNNALFGFAFVVFNFLSTATTPTVAAALAAGDRRRCGETVGQALALAAALGALVWVGLAANADTSLSLMGLDAASDPTLFASARSYLLLRAGAAPAALLVTVSQGVFRGLQDMRTPLAVTVATNTLHLGASLALVLPAGGLGLDGAALSTVGAEWAAAGTYLALVWRRREDLGLNPLPEVNPAVAWRAYGPFVASGGAVLMRTAVLLGTKTLASAVAARLGATSIASHQVLYQVWILASMLVDSLAIAGQTMVAVALGEGDPATARRLTGRLLQMGALLGLALAVALSTASDAWPRAFSSDPAVLSAVSELLPLATWLLPLNALVYVLDGVLVGAADFQFLVAAMLASSAGAVGALLSVEPMGLGLRGVWGAQALLMVARLATLTARYQSEDGPLPPSCEAGPGPGPWRGGRSVAQPAEGGGGWGGRTLSAPSRRGSEGGDVEPPPQARLAHRPQAPGVHQAEPQQQQHEQQHGQQHEPQQDLPCGAAQTEQPGGDCDHPGPCEAAYTEQAGGDGDQPDNGAGPGVLRASSPLSRSCSAALTPMPGCAPVPLAVAELADSVRVAAGVSAALPRSHSMRCRAVRHDEGSSRAGGH